jgi:hypothetical protein
MQVGVLVNETATKNCMEKICDDALNHYGNNTADIRKCPNSECSYYGVITLKECRESLECPQCKRQWRDLVHYSASEKFIKQIKDTIQLNSESFSSLHSVLFEEPCPKCGVLI